ncbi:hypothetical protein ACXYMX_06655 [Sporosarcina sp. CAU 1771]
MKITYGFWLGWFAILMMAIGLFQAPYWFGSISLILGLLCLRTPHKILASSAIALATLILLIELLQ